jgi:nucleoside-diphosphate-sugar epimerase
MRVFLAGATGAIGKRLVPLLVNAGHVVAATTRRAGRAPGLRAVGAEPVVVDALDRDAIRAAVMAARPEVIVHQLTAIPERFNFARFDRAFTPTNRLRTEATDHLLAAAQMAGTRRIVAQSFAGWPYARTGEWVKSENDPLDPDPPPAFRNTLAAIRHLETAVLNTKGVDGVVLRYGAFYGPGTAIGAGGALLDDIRRRRVPIVGGGTGMWSFVHIDDAARVTASAIGRGAPGIYNVVDDEPARVAEWLPFLAAALGAKTPRRIPAIIARLAIGRHGVAMMTDVRGASNAKAKRELAWHPQYASWRTGFTTGLSN